MAHWQWHAQTMKVQHSGTLRTMHRTHDASTEGDKQQSKTELDAMALVV